MSSSIVMVARRNGAITGDEKECNLQLFCTSVGVAAVQPLEVSAFSFAMGAGAGYECDADERATWA
jgi:hypothetical protein